LGIKGHAVISPQDTRQLLDILPLPRSRLPDVVRVVWTGSSPPTSGDLRSKLSVRTVKVYNALQWLCRNNEDYKNSVVIDHAEFQSWPPVFIATELIETMGYISSNIVEEMQRAGVATDSSDTAGGVEDEVVTVSSILDVNNVTQSANAATLRRLAQMTSEDTINVMPGVELKSEWDDPTYFTSAMPPIFPYGSGKHLDARRRKRIPLHKWVSLLLAHCSG
jgi:hypothetical protein